ncbi:sugar transferase [Candidatus Saccharibacteria bacterium]|nr:sugar transferase [Candidatus Saccharibacteria bacterium]
MQKKSDFVLRLCLIIGDALMLVLSFAAAYYIRVHVDPRPYEFEPQLWEFTKTVVFLVPVLLVILAALGLYKKSVFLSKSLLPETGRLILAAVLSVCALIVYGFFSYEDLFPVRIMTVVSMALSFGFLIVERNLLRFFVKKIFKKGYGVKKVLIVGDNSNTEYLANYIASAPESGYSLAGIVASKKYIPDDLKKKQYSSLKAALEKKKVDVIFQTDEEATAYVYKQAIAKHLLYYFVPSETALSSHLGELELVGNTPAMLVKVTPLSGGNAVVKRIFDIVISLIAIILLAIPMAVVWLALKLSDFKHSPIYAGERLTQYGRRFKCYKFRSLKPEYSGMSPEEAFLKMGKPELADKYYFEGRLYLDNDPRITKIGAFIRKTSIDELPQLFNVLKGDISLIGPRALPPKEMHDFGERSSLILTVKSGLTGFAQVLGRRDISFEERRVLDIYYVKNWSLLLDFQIFFKTIAVVIRGEGAK